MRLTACSLNQVIQPPKLDVKKPTTKAGREQAKRFKAGLQVLIFKLPVFLKLTNMDPFAALFVVTGDTSCGRFLEPLAPFP